MMKSETFHWYSHLSEPTNNIRDTLQDVERVNISTYNQQLMQDQKFVSFT